MSMSPGPSIKWVGTPDARANSASRWLFELLRLPTTRTTLLGGELPHRLLAILRGVADVVPRWTDDLGESPPQPLDDLGRIVDR